MVIKRSVSLPKDLVEKIQEKGEQNQRNFSAELRFAVYQYYKQQTEHTHKQLQEV